MDRGSSRGLADSPLGYTAAKSLPDATTAYHPTASTPHGHLFVLKNLLVLDLHFAQDLLRIINIRTDARHLKTLLLSFIKVSLNLLSFSSPGTRTNKACFS